MKTSLLNLNVKLLLFVSGAAGLVYEIVWARYLALFLGHTSYAVITVLTAFMGGLALGSLWLGKRADRTERPLRLYGFLELGIGLYALVFPLYYSLCRSGYMSLVVSVKPDDTVRLGLQFLFSAATILPPTVLMGGTLPVLAKFMTRSVSELRGKVAALYAINSAGAVAGCLLADFWLIPGEGLGATVRWAMVMNLLAGLGALALDRQRYPIEPEIAGIPEDAQRVERFSSEELKLAVFAIGASGFVAMLYEVAWTRLLALVMGSSTHAFSIMLATFISGIAAGAWLLGRWRRTGRTLEAFAWLEIALAAAILFSMSVYSYLPYWFASVANLLTRSEEAYPLYVAIQVATCFAVAFVPTVFLGMTFPLASRVAAGDVSGTGGAVGRVYAVNTLGTVLGAVVAGLCLMPWLGLARTFVIGAGINLALGLAILDRNHRSRRVLLAGSAIALTIGFLAVSVPWLDHWPQRLNRGLWRSQKLPASVEEFAQTADANILRYYRDGAGVTVSVNAYPNANGNPTLILRVNGKADAGNSGDVPTQLLLGHLPMLLHRDPRQALVIGLGSGMTCGAIAAYPSVRRLDVAEISPEVAMAAREFAAENRDVLSDPRFHLALEDAKSFLRTTPGTYDVIVSEPSNPWVAGVAGLFSQEFYEDCRARLSRGGLMSQWVQLYETSDEALNIVLRTFTSVFPYTSVWRMREDLILIGSAEPPRVSLDSLVSRFNLPSVREDLGRIDFTSVPVLLLSEIISAENGAFVVPPDGPIQRDLFPVLEYVEQRAFFAREIARSWGYFDENERPRPETLLGQYLETHELTTGDLRAFVTCSSVHHYFSPRVIRGAVRRWQDMHPADPEPADMLSRLTPPDPAPDAAVQRMAPLRKTIWEQSATDPKPLIQYRNALWQSYFTLSSALYVPRSDELQSALGRLIEADSANQRMYKLELAKLAWDSGRDADCIRFVFNALDLNAPGGFDFDPNAEVVPDVISRVAEMAWRGGNTQRALDLCKLIVQADSVNPRLGMVRRKLASSSPPAVLDAGP